MKYHYHPEMSNSSNVMGRKDVLIYIHVMQVVVWKFLEVYETDG